ncbi:MAG: D-isomer specific 2-hydroxyacid dehydrogenase [Candidatus Wolfebacteria bacterium GW2011_GWA2_42_10]|uniref:D-isomer specific 2-hydroxyacid dehydrogenase n=1 Tax=Candidatus Wolfebacteria bacterium GW2011_GWA2_42_10 TaxID=1619004 RepID=A0A0G0XLM8_9BACT|nr:MAG: D-isomer specific 2-hydroxyacid dehydrogenase [Candidatus Wolfebacteria bacterium GW2011_GWA2_42_10]
MSKVFITRKIPEAGAKLLKEKGCEVDISAKDGVLTKEELMFALRGKKYDAVLCLLTDKIDGDVFESAGSQCKIFANFAVGFDNIDLATAKEKGILITNTPGVLTETVAEHTFALVLAIAHRIAESDRFTRNGKYVGWQPMLFLGTDVSRKTLGIFVDLETLLKESDFISIHVPLLPETRHLIGENQLKMMKKNAYLINTSRGPIIDEKALVQALKENWIRGAALDVYENEPALAPGLAELDNVILTSHIASATEETRAKMSELAATNIIEALEGRMPPNLVK